MILTYFLLDTSNFSSINKN